MKPFETYHHLEGEPMTDRDRKQIGSKFWGRGKWDNFVKPHLKIADSFSDLTLVDMGCNAGLFLQFAQEAGFGRIVGVESNVPAIKKGEAWRDRNGGKYKFVQSDINACIDKLPIADFTVLSNLHYYFTINDWIDYLDVLQKKTRYVIIVTAEKHHVNRCWASADVASIRKYFKNWKEVSFVDELPLEGDPDPRRLWSLCFESPLIEAVPPTSLDSGNHVQDEFWGELDKGKDFKGTRYYRILKKYREKWGENRLHAWFDERIKTYNDLKENGQKIPILVDGGTRILDGNHRNSMMTNLKYKNVFIRRTA